jgi:hypothetical protein
MFAVQRCLFDQLHVEFVYNILQKSISERNVNLVTIFYVIGKGTEIRNGYAQLLVFFYTSSHIPGAVHK